MSLLHFPLLALAALEHEPPLLLLATLVQVKCA
jgi:hypothetical protein